jgi:uncharacterized membrane protein
MGGVRSAARPTAAWRDRCQDRTTGLSKSSLTLTTSNSTGDILELTTEVTIKSSVESVARYAADPTNAPTWYQHIVDVELPVPSPLRPGAVFTFVARLPIGVTRRFSYEVVQFVPGSRLLMKADAGPFPMVTTYQWEAHGDHTVMRLTNSVAPRGPQRAVLPLLAAAMRRANRADLDRLRAVLETPAS